MRETPYLRHAEDVNFLFVVELVIVVAGAGRHSPMKLMLAGPLTACLDLVEK